MSRTAQTDDMGNFSFSRLADGPYWISTVADSYPPGYAIADVVEDPVIVAAGAPVEYDVLVRALRSVSGTVTRMEPTGPVPIVGAKVTISELHRTTSTNVSGRFRFIDLPSGTFTVEVLAAGQRYEQQVVVPSGPANLSNTNFTLTPAK